MALFTWAIKQIDQHCAMGQLDIPAMIRCRKNRKRQVILLGHSAGANCWALFNYEKVAKVVAVSGSTGYVYLKGRTNSCAVYVQRHLSDCALHTGLCGQPMPLAWARIYKDVAREWAQFCKKSPSRMNAIGKTVHTDFHHEIQAPINVLRGLSDDEIANALMSKILVLVPPNVFNSND